VAARSLLLEASWNNRSQQGPGFLAAIDPALRVIHEGDRRALAEARLRALAFFNTNPVSSSLVIGAALNLEERAKLGLIDERRRAATLAALSSALAAQGDRLFWQSWLPVCCLAACLAACWTASPSWALLAPLLYGAAAVPVRLLGLGLGYREGKDVYTVIRRFHVDLATRWLSRAAAALLAILTALSLRAAAGAIPGPGWRALSAGVAVFAAVRLYKLAIRGRRRLAAWLLYPALLAAAALAAALL
jgi:mannose/fructose/N-acetylgalactosamine-specific phosphotransferase system component IID